MRPGRAQKLRVKETKRMVQAARTKEVHESAAQPKVDHATETSDETPGPRVKDPSSGSEALNGDLTPDSMAKGRRRAATERGAVAGSQDCRIGSVEDPKDPVQAPTQGSASNQPIGGGPPLKDPDHDPDVCYRDGGTLDAEEVEGELAVLRRERLKCGSRISKWGIPTTKPKKRSAD
jgi:hypothetical protein